MVYLINSYSIMLTSKHVLGLYTFTNVSKHVFKIHMCVTTYGAAWLPDILVESSTGTRPR